MNIRKRGSIRRLFWCRPPYWWNSGPTRPSKFNFREIITVSSKSKEWPAELGRITTQLSFGVATSFIVIVTYKSFTKPAFQTYFKRLPKTTVLLADEAHNIASPAVAKLLDGIHLTKRIGLSATPKRIYDPEGSDHMEAFFHDKEPYVYSFSMERAMTKVSFARIITTQIS